MTQYFGEFLFAETQRIEINVLFGECLKLEPKHVEVPGCVQRQLVIRQPEGTLLILCQVPKDYHGNVSEPELARREHSAMAGNNIALRIHQNGVVEAESLNAAGNLRYLRVGMFASITGVGDQAVNEPCCQLHFRGLRIQLHQKMS